MQNDVASTNAKLLEDKATLTLALQQGTAFDYNKTLKATKDAVAQSREAIGKFNRVRAEM